MASTAVRSVTDGHPIEGHAYVLVCDITAGDPRTANKYEWKRDGVTQRATGDTLTIRWVKRSMQDSVYTCAADNGAGVGEHGAAFTFTVWCKLSTMLRKIVVTLGT